MQLVVKSGLGDEVAVQVLLVMETSSIAQNDSPSPWVQQARHYPEFYSYCNSVPGLSQLAVSAGLITNYATTTTMTPWREKARR